MANIFRNKQNRRADAEIASKKNIIKDRKLDTRVLRTFNAGGVVTAGQSGRLNRVLGEKGKTITRNMSGVRTDNAGNVGGSGGVGRKFR